jgi:2-succinyl-6-hydroxy-2,4-cyclohexadiene-1-carboxylate synthase
MSEVFALHGFTGSPESFAGLAASMPDTRFVAPAILGHEGEASARTFEEEVTRLATLAQGMSDATLLGYSLGGRLALALLARGVVFRRAIIIGAAVGLESEQARTERRAADARFIRLLREEGIEAFADAWEAQPIFVAQRSEARKAQRRAQDALGLARSLEVLGLAEMPYLRPALVDVRVPIAYVAGERDTKFVALGTELAARLPNITLHVMPGAGHDVLLEAEHAVLALLRAGTNTHEETTR